MEISIVFPHQLYARHPALDKERPVVLIEDQLFFNQYVFHVQKIILHRASMKYYRHFLENQGYQVDYIDAADSELDQVFTRFKNQGIKTIHYADTTDYLLERRLNRFARLNSITLFKSGSPDFLTATHQLEGLFAKEKKYLMANFYMKQRRRLDILMVNDEPAGGQWSFDAENRQRVPKGLKLPAVFSPGENEYTREARQYVKQQFKNNPGQDEKFSWPVTHADAEQALEDFLKHRMKNFGAYEDAIVKEESVLFHAALTPALNIGLLSPQQIIAKAFSFHETIHYPLNSLEGFVRQIIGWREFMRAIYLREGVKQRTRNAMGFTRKIPASFYNGTTGIEPVDQTIRKVLATGYCHHIERLMVLGNFMLLCEFDPDEVYRWFMELFIDAYDWVMVPNVYGMSQYADDGLITTKPYVSGSNYLLKMSDYTRGPWCEVWDSLYWRFIDLHQDKFIKNPRMSMMVNLILKMEPDKRRLHHQRAELFLQSMDDPSESIPVKGK